MRVHLDIVHQSCLDKYGCSLPANTTPAGYTCPRCKVNDQLAASDNANGFLKLGGAWIQGYVTLIYVAAKSSGLTGYTKYSS